MSQASHTQFIDTYLAGLQALKVSEESLYELRKALKVVQIKSKHTLLVPGEISRHIYVIIKGGFVCRYIHEKTAEAKTINFYLEDLHPVMAPLDSFFTQQPTQCEIKAVTDSAVVAVPKSLIDILRKRDEAFSTFYQEVAITALVEENEVKTKLIAYSSKEKYDFILQTMPSVIQKVPSKYIAEFCGISPEWLSKLKKQG